MFKYSDSNKRYYTLDYFYKHKFNSKVFKVSLDMGLSCPNIDGKVGTGGCIYCSNGSGEFAGDKNKSIKEQFEDVKNVILKKWPNSKYIAYFQSHTNTYAPLDFLKKNYEEALSIDGVVGLSIATRPDSIEDDVMKGKSEKRKR